MILGEACWIAVCGGILGIGLGCLCLQAYTERATVFPFSILEMAGTWMLVLLAIAAGIGLVSGIVPAIRAAQLSVIDGLRRVI